MKQPCVHIVANRRNGTIYVGVTSYLPKRAYEHREGDVSGFTSRYGCKMLVWYEVHATMADAIAREKQNQGRQSSPQDRSYRSPESDMAGFVRKPDLAVIARSGGFRLRKLKRRSNPVNLSEQA